METGIQVGHVGADPEGVAVATSAVMAIMDKAFETRASETVILAAFNVLEKSVAVNNVSISGNSIDGDRTVNI